MNVKQILHDFTLKAITDAPGTAALSGSDIKMMRFYQLQPGATIEIGDVMNSKVVFAANNIVGNENIDIPVLFIVVPVSQKFADLLNAQESSRAMADEWLELLFADRTVGGAFCFGISDDVRQSDEWINPTTTPAAVCAVQLRINPR